MEKDGDFREKAVVITGASFGIGQELALQLADGGAWLALAARSAERLEEIAKQCVQRGGRAMVIPTDVADKAQCQNLIARAVEAYGRIDVLVNNAGFGIAGKFETMRDLAQFEKVIQVNFMGSVYCTHYALPHLKETRGRLVGISSLLGKIAPATADGYGASKHAMAGFFDSLRMELSGSGVSVTMIYPGWVQTGITSRALMPDGKPRGEVSALEKNGMPVETCVRRIVQAVAKRKRELIMTREGKVALWLKLIAPGLVDQLSRKSTEYK